MGQVKEKAAGGKPAAGDTDNGGGPVVYPDNTIIDTDGQESGGNGAGEQDYLKTAFDYASAAMSSIELGLFDILPSDLEHLQRIRTAHLSRAENEALNTLIIGAAQSYPKGVQTQILTELNLGLDHDALAELAEAVGILPRGATWEEMLTLIGPISWSWADWLPEGFLTIVAGEPGQGKSVLCLRIAATFLRGDPWPNGTPCEAEPGAVLWCEAEAAQALNLERAKCWGLPLDKLYTPLSDPLSDVQLDIPEHLEAVEELARRPEVRAVIVDSLRGIHRGDENSSASMEIVAILAALARDTRKPILLTHHLRKRGMLDIGGDRVNLERIRGSSAIIQAARMVWAIDAPDPDSEESKRVSVIKSNLARFPEPIGFTIGDGMHLVFGDAPEAPRQETELDRARDFLLDLLDKEPLWQKDIEHEAKGAGIAWATIRRAQKTLRVVSSKSKEDQKWYWALPAREEYPPH